MNTSAPDPSNSAEVDTSDASNHTPDTKEELSCRTTTTPDLAAGTSKKGMQMQRDSDWPTTEGPFKTLSDLRLQPAGVRPKWARHMRIEQLQDTTAYRARPVYLNTDAIRLLAALTFEGFDVDIQATSHGELHLSIYQPSRRDAE